MKKYDCIAAFGCSFVHGDAIFGGIDERHTNKQTKFVGDKYRFSKILADHYGIPEVNMAGSGMSNEAIFRRVHRFFKMYNQYQNPLVIIGISGLSRNEVFSTWQDRFFDIHQSDIHYHSDKNQKAVEDMAIKFTGDIKNTERLKDYVQFKMKYFFDDEMEREKLDWQLTFLIGFLNSKKIPYVLFNSIEDRLSDEIKQSSNYLSFGQPSVKDSYTKHDNYLWSRDGYAPYSNTDCWYTDMYDRHTKKYGDWEKAGSRSMFEPYGEFACGGHPSPNTHKTMANKILKYIKMEYKNNII